MNNYLDGAVGYTCLGLTPDLAWRWKSKYFAYCDYDCGSRSWFQTASYRAHFAQCCYNTDPKQFQNATRQLWTNEIYRHSGCYDLGWPSFFACAKASVTDSIKAAKDTVSRATKEWCSNGVNAASCDQRLHCVMVTEYWGQRMHERTEPDNSQRIYLKGTHATLCTLWYLCRFGAGACRVICACLPLSSWAS